MSGAAVRRVGICLRCMYIRRSRIANIVRTWINDVVRSRGGIYYVRHEKRGHFGRINLTDTKVSVVTITDDPVDSGACEWALRGCHDGDYVVIHFRRCSANIQLAIVAMYSQSTVTFCVLVDSYYIHMSCI